MLGLDRISNGQGGYYSAQEANAILTDFITLSTQGLGESFLMENSNNPLIHAFLNESGLRYNSFAPETAWARNEEMVDWIAIQFPKLMKAFRDADAI